MAEAEYPKRNSIALGTNLLWTVPEDSIDSFPTWADSLSTIPFKLNSLSPETERRFSTALTDFYIWTTSLAPESTEISEGLVRALFDTGTGGSFENRLNAQRLTQFKSEFSTKLIHLLREQDFEYGFNSAADTVVKECLAQNEAVTKQWLNELFVANFGDTTVATGVLKVISHIAYDQIAPEGPTMALAALSNKNAEIQEGGIRAFENWGNATSLEILSNVKCTENWLEEYCSQVVADLTAELA